MSLDDIDRAVLTRPKRAEQMLDCSRPYLDRLLKAGEIEFFRDGRAIWILVPSIHRYIQRKVEAARVSEAVE
jgi:hypothetical protein